MPTSVVGEDVIAELVRVAGGCPHGAIVEVGVYKGGTAWHLNELCNKQDRELYLYDTFCGIPFKDEIDPMTVGSFSDTSREAVEEAIPGAKVIAGVFPASAVPMPMIGFAHIDCDQYRSVKDAIDYLLPRMLRDGVMWFDDYGYLAGATKAVQERFGIDKILIARCNKGYVRT